MNTDYFQTVKRDLLTSLHGCIYGVSEIMSIHCWCLTECLVSNPQKTAARWTPGSGFYAD